MISSIPSTFNSRHFTPVKPHLPTSQTGFYPIHVVAPELIAALRILEVTGHASQDEAALIQLGVTLPFRSGSEAVKLLKNRQIRIEFGPLGNPTVHAIWIQEEKRLVVNERYRGNMSPPVLCAIAEAIYHEAGHVIGAGDNHSSLQEEINCLALNVLAYRTHCRLYPQLTQMTHLNPHLKALFDNGVALYNRLFFDPDPTKAALVDRLIQKYGLLVPESPDHPIPSLSQSPTLAQRVLYEKSRRNAQHHRFQSF